MKHLCSCLLLSSLVLLTACAINPVQTTPDVSIGDWIESSSLDNSKTDWWTDFNDPELNRLFVKSKNMNMDLQEALSRIIEFRAHRNAIAGINKPTLNISSSLGRFRLSENGSLPVSQIPGYPIYQTLYEVGFDASWELDFFGGKASKIDAAQAKLEQSVDIAKDIELAVSAEIARAYFELRGVQQLIVTQESILTESDKAFVIATNATQLGEGSEIQLLSIKQNILQLQSELKKYQAQAQTLALSIGMLVGDLPESELHLLDGTPMTVSLSMIPIGQRANLLRRRYDIRSAEKLLIARSAEVGIAVAELFPKFRIGASGNFESIDEATLFNSSSQAWGIFPTVSWRVFDRNMIKSEIQASQAKVEQAAINYKKTVLNALNEAEKAISDYKFALEEIELQKNALNLTQQRHHISQQSYQLGAISEQKLIQEYLETLMLTKKYQNSHSIALTKLVSLYKVLGGDWSTVHSEGYSVQ